MTIIGLPFPPSTNSLTNVYRGKKIKDTKYRDWETRAWGCILQQRPEKIKGRYIMTIVAVRPDKRKRDISNLIKSTEDILVKTGIVEDDSLCESLRIGWSSCTPDPLAGISITLEEFDD